jgi:hypothetical protein
MCDNRRENISSAGQSEMNSHISITDKQPEHCSDSEKWKTCPVLKAFRCPDKYICSGCEFIKTEKGE